MSRREYLMLAHPYAPAKHTVGGWYASIKLDGVRCFWDGGVSIGRPKVEIPWANLYRDTEKKRAALCTGLWSRYGNIIHAPDFFIKSLPLGILLDGELWCGRGKFQETVSIVSKDVPVFSEWMKVVYKVFDLPSKRSFCNYGEVNVPNCKMAFDQTHCLELMADVIDPGVIKFQQTLQYHTKYRHLTNQAWGFLSQTLLPYTQTAADGVLDVMLKNELEKQGEGIIVRSPASIWVPSRVHTMLKVKPFDIDTGTVVGYIAGEGKYLGMLGGLILEWNAKRFSVSGFTDIERQITNPVARAWALANPGAEYQGMDSICHFKYGDQIKFKYRTLTDIGIPREARYHRCG